MLTQANVCKSMNLQVNIMNLYTPYTIACYQMSLRLNHASNYNSIPFEPPKCEMANTPQGPERLRLGSDHQTTVIIPECSCIIILISNDRALSTRWAKGQLNHQPVRGSTYGQPSLACDDIMENQSNDTMTSSQANDGRT